LIKKPKITTCSGCGRPVKSAIEKRLAAIVFGLARAELSPRAADGMASLTSLEQASSFLG
jgi:hypothetical protein